MMKKLRGRNLKHPGCLIGVTLGLIIGIVLGGVLASVFNVAMSIDVWVWFGIMFVLGATGWIIGDRLSSRFPALEEEAPETTRSDLSQSS
jgi:MFS family permease